MKPNFKEVSSESTVLVGIRLLEEYLDSRVFILMRDNTVAEGILRSYDQYYNILLEDSKEMRVEGEEYSTLESETVLIRGENILLLGEGGIEENEGMKKIEYKVGVKPAVDDLDYIAL